MRDWLALRNLAVVLGVVAASLLVLWVLVTQGVTAYIVPPPDSTAEEFVRALKAHRYEAAVNELTEDLQGQVTSADLQALVREVEAQHGGIEDAQGQDSQEQGDEATATVQVKLADGKDEELTFALQKENGIWDIASVDALHALVGP